MTAIFNRKTGDDLVAIIIIENRAHVRVSVVLLYFHVRGEESCHLGGRAHVTIQYERFAHICESVEKRP